MKLLTVLFASGALLVGSGTDVFFGNENQITAKLVEEVNQEKNLVQLVTKKLSNRRIVSALVDAKKRGVVVEVILDDIRGKPPRSLKRLNDAKIPLYVYRPEGGGKKQPRLSESFCILTNKVCSGAFTLAPKRNFVERSHMLTIDQAPSVESFMKEFEGMKLKLARRVIL